MKTSDFSGTGTLFRLFLRRDRFLLSVWILLPVILLLGNAATFIAMDGQSQGLQRALTEFNNDPLISSLLGPVMSIDLPGAIVWRTVSLLALVLGLSSLLAIIRHTRTDEETGRSELISAYIVGRYANLTAALILTVVGNLVAGVLISFGTIGLGGKQAVPFCLERPCLLLAAVLPESALSVFNSGKPAEAPAVLVSQLWAWECCWRF
jgi:ABC-2 type transport system permease protein